MPGYENQIPFLNNAAISNTAHAGDSTLSAAIDGCLGAAVGKEIGGRDGAVVESSLSVSLVLSGKTLIWSSR